MTRIQFTILFLACAAIIIGGVLLGSAAFADEPVCQTEEQITAFVEADGGTIAGAAYYRGETTDTMLIVETPVAIVIYGFKDGCLTAAVALEPREQATPA